MAAGGSGGEPVSGGSSRTGLRITLVVAVLVLAVTCVVGGFFSYLSRDDRTAAETEAERYGDVLESATAEAEAFINIRYDDAQASIDKVAAGATGAFREQYESSTESVIQVLEDNRSIQEGEVIWAGVVDLDNDSARVIAATTGTVANVASDNLPVGRNYRLQLDLVLEDGVWLTNNLEFVG